MAERRHFETFDALRFLAFFCVFLSHLPAPDHSWITYFQKSGVIGVRFFFVLSGFLISYILLFEKQKAGNVNLRNFFIRRILRIWPLFYAMLLFAFLTPLLLHWLGLNSSADGYVPNWFASVLFLENYQMMATGTFPNVSPLTVMWSLCIEEHYYILWGLLLFLIPLKHIPKLIVVSIVVAIISRILYSESNLPFIDLPTNLDFFAFGAIPAFCLIKNSEIINRLRSFSPLAKFVAALLTVTYVFVAPHLSFPTKEHIDPLLFGILFMTLLFFTLPDNNRLYISDKNILSKMGRYTYGLYLFHTIFINFLLQLTHTMDFALDSTLHYILFWFSALLLTLGASYLSYHFFEKQFLKLKSRFNRAEVSSFAE